MLLKYIYKVQHETRIWPLILQNHIYVDAVKIKTPNGGTLSNLSNMSMNELSRLRNPLYSALLCALWLIFHRSNALPTVPTRLPGKTAICNVTWRCECTSETVQFMRRTDPSPREENAVSSGHMHSYA